VCKVGAEVSVCALVDAADPRSLRLALALDPSVAHPVACRLASTLERWTAPGVGRTAHSERAAALELGVPLEALRSALALRDRPDDARAAAAEAARAARRPGARLVSAGAPGYPEPFAQLDLPPPALWIAGELPDSPAVALVGARRASRYGVEIAGWLAREVASVGVSVVSGFAVGVDAAAHRGALEAPGGRTVAVLGCGLGVDYPRGHGPLGAEIRERGALVSEFAPERRPDRWSFPIRNRLIAALARAVVVVEARPRSGSLVTARLALELGRELLAVPGRVSDELALGTNALIADGATPALTPDDLLAAAGLELRLDAAPPPGAPPELAGDGRALWLAAADEPRPAEALAAAADLPVERALAGLLELELGGWLRRAIDGRYLPLESRPRSEP
jgi:DNA processing protein